MVPIALVLPGLVRLLPADSWSSCPLPKPVICLCSLVNESVQFTHAIAPPVAQDTRLDEPLIHQPVQALHRSVNIGRAIVEQQISRGFNVSAQW
jgi:hypothetical protein